MGSAVNQIPMPENKSEEAGRDMGQVDLGGGQIQMFFGKAADRATESVVDSERVHGPHARHP